MALDRFFETKSKRGKSLLSLNGYEYAFEVKRLTYNFLSLY